MFSATTGLTSEPRLLEMDKPEEQVNTRPAPILTPLANYLSLDVQKQLNRAEINKAVDIRMPTTALLTINSADRYASQNARSNNPGNGNPYTLTSPADFTINLPQNILNGYFTRIAVTQINLYYSWPVICNATNGIYINYQPGGAGAVTQYFITMAYSLASSIPGSIPLGTWATALQTAIRAATGNNAFTVAYGGTFANAFNFASTNTDKFYFSRWIGPAGLNSPTLFDLMGFPAQVVLSTTSYGLAQATFFRTPYIDIVCEQITGNQSLRDASSTPGGNKVLLARLPLTSEGIVQSSTPFQGPSYYITKTYPVPKQISWPANQPLGGSLHFQLLDAAGNVLTNGANYNDTDGNLGAFCDANMGDWQMVLQVSEL